VKGIEDRRSKIKRALDERSFDFVTPAGQSSNQFQKDLRMLVKLYMKYFSK